MAALYIGDTRIGVGINEVEQQVPIERLSIYTLRRKATLISKGVEMRDQE